MKKRIPFGVWEPDSNAVGGLGRLSEAVNVVPVKGGYKVIDGWGAAWGWGAFGSTPQQYVTTPITPTNVIGAISVSRDDYAALGVVLDPYPIDIISTTTAIYWVPSTGATASVITGSAATANPLAAEDTTGRRLYYRDMTQYGGVVIATSGYSSTGTAPIVAYTVTSGGSFVDIAAGFSADYVTTLRDFVVYGSTYDSVDERRYNRIRWSGFGDYKQNTPSPATQADIQDLVPEFGPVRRLLGGNDVIIVCDNGIVLMEYVGGATIMRFTYLNKGFGTNHSLSCVRIGDYVYMYSHSGFRRVGKAEGDVMQIGDGRVDKEFAAKLIEGLTSSDQTPIVRAYHDESNGCIGWQYGSDGKAFVYSYRYDQWVHHGTSSDRSGLYYIYSSGSPLGAGQALPRYFQKRRAPAAIGANGILYTQINESQKAKFVLSTGYEELSPGKKSVVDKVWPVQDVRGGSQTNPELVVTSIPKLNGVNLYAEPTSTYSSTASLQSDGFFTVTGPGSYEGKFHRFQLENSDTASERAGEQAILGIDVEFFERGNY